MILPSLTIGLRSNPRSPRFRCLCNFKNVSVSFWRAMSNESGWLRREPWSLPLFDLGLLQLFLCHGRVCSDFFPDWLAESTFRCKSTLDRCLSTNKLRFRTFFPISHRFDASSSFSELLSLEIQTHTGFFSMIQSGICCSDNKNQRMELTWWKGKKSLMSDRVALLLDRAAF